MQPKIPQASNPSPSIEESSLIPERTRMCSDSGSNQISARGLRLLWKGNHGHVLDGPTGCNWAVIKSSQIFIVSITHIM